MRILKFRSINRPTNFAASCKTRSWKKHQQRSNNKDKHFYNKWGISRSVPVTPGSSGAFVETRTGHQPHGIIITQELIKCGDCVPMLSYTWISRQFGLSADDYITVIGWLNILQSHWLMNSGGEFWKYM